MVNIILRPLKSVIVLVVYYKKKFEWKFNKKYLKIYNYIIIEKI